MNPPRAVVTSIHPNLSLPPPQNTQNKSMCVTNRFLGKGSWFSLKAKERERRKGLWELGQQKGSREVERGRGKRTYSSPEVG